jgi:titin
MTRIEGAPWLSPNGLGIDGLVLGGGNSVVRGLATLNCGLNDIHVASRGNLVEGNLIGLIPGDATGVTPGRAGVRISGVGGNTIGGTAPPARNVISAKTYGVVVSGGSAAGNQIRGNFIGTTTAGTAGRGHLQHGVLVSNAPSTVIGGTAAGAGNLISGNSQYGVVIQGGFATGTLVQGNRIGTNAAGTAAIANTADGILVSSAPGTTIGGTAAGARNVLAGNLANGLRIMGNTSTATLVLGNFIGTNAAGTAALGNGQVGLRIDGAPNTVVGGAAAGARNVIAASGQHGIQVSGVDATGTVVLGNVIGLNAAGTAALGNALSGVFADGAPGAVIGGATTGAGNVISGNAQSGLRVIGSTAAGAVVQGNRIGTTALGTAKLGNASDGVLIRQAPGALIGGLTAGTGNLIAGNAASGISLENAETTGTLVQGNLIGTNAAGTAALGNAADGVTIVFAPGNTIGGAVAGARNVIAGNAKNGVSIDGPGAAGNRVQGNFIGTDVTGTLDLGNGQHGVDVVNQDGTTIGGTTALARNVIAGNTQNGIRLAGAGTKATLVQGNFIGTTGTGTAALPNTGHGILLTTGSPSSNTIGGTAAGAGNTLAFNGGASVFVESGTGNAILGNALFSNGALGIDLAPAGVTANDPGDGDTGANNLQNFPVLTAATNSGTSTTITGSLDSTPSTTFRLEFFRSAACDAAGNGEGQVFLGFKQVTTNSSGSVAFTHVVTPAVPLGQPITATATPTTGPGANSTSEFSACRAASAAAPGPGLKPPRGGGLPSITSD